MAIPTNNDPAKTADKATRDAEFEKRLTEAITKVRERVGSTEERVKKVEKDKLETLWETGKDIVELMKEGEATEKKTIIMRFAKEIGNEPAFFYLCTNFYERFDEASYKKAVEHGLKVKVVKALIAVRDEKLLEKLIKRAIEEGLSEDDIRNITGKKGARSNKTANAARAKDANKTPLQVFVKGNDRLKMFSETLDSCTDAFNRLASSKSEEQRQNAIDQLIAYRAGLKAAIAGSNTFLKFTNGIEAKAGKVEKP